MKFLESVSFAGSYRRTNSAGAVRGSWGTGGARYTKKGRRTSWLRRKSSTWSACSVADSGVRPCVGMFVVKAALPKVQELPALPQWKVA